MTDPNDARAAADRTAPGAETDAAPDVESFADAQAPDLNEGPRLDGDDDHEHDDDEVDGVGDDGVGEDEFDDDSFAVRVGMVADYLEDNAAAVFEEAVSRPLDHDDPLLEKLVMGVFARYFVENLQHELRKSKGRRADIEKLTAARSVIDDAVVSALRHFSGGRLKEIAWRGPGDEQLLAFAYAVVAAWQVGATADALLDIELGLDPEKMEQLTEMLGELVRRREAGELEPEGPDARA